MVKSITEQWIAAQPERHAPDGRRLFNCQNCRQQVAIPRNGLPVHRTAVIMREKTEQLQEAVRKTETIRRQKTQKLQEAVADVHADPNQQVDLVVDRQPTHDSPRQQPTRFPMTRGIIKNY